MFNHAIVRPPGTTFTQGITTAGLGLPDLETARAQHREYVSTLKACGLSVSVLEPLTDFPDATFVEDTAVMTRDWAVVSRPGAPARLGETERMRPMLENRFQDIGAISSPGTLDGGDVLAVGTDYFIGLSDRTNADGAAQLARFLERRGCRAVTVSLKRLLHLKTGVSWLGGDTLLVTGELAGCEAFAGYKRIVVDPAEAYAANAIRINDHVILPEGFPDTHRRLDAAGYSVLAVNVSEFQKMDGGVSCLSLRY